MIVTGFSSTGIGFFKLFFPPAPLFLLVLLVPIEIISFLTRPISLSVRLFANMLAGHAMLQVFAGFGSRWAPLAASCRRCPSRPCS